MTKTIDIEEASTRLHELASEAAAGTDIILLEDGTPLARLACVEPAKLARVAGLHQGKVRVSEDFDEPLPDEFWLGKQ